MSAFDIAVEIDAPPSVVFDVLADTENAPRWYEAVVSATRITPGPLGEGTRHRLVRSLPGGRVENEVEITEWEPDHRVTLTSRTGPTPFRYRYTLHAASGRTRLELHGEITPDGLAGVAGLRPLAALAFKRGMQHNLASLKRVVESGGGNLR